MPPLRAKGEFNIYIQLWGQSCANAACGTQLWCPGELLAPGICLALGHWRWTTGLLELLKLLCGREAGMRGKEERGQPRDPCWLQPGGSRERMDTPLSWCNSPRSHLSPIPLLSPCPDTVPGSVPAEGTAGRAEEEGRVARNWDRLLARDLACCPGAAQSPLLNTLAAPTCPWKKELRGGLSPAGNPLLSQCFSKRMNEHTVHHWLCCTFSFSPLISPDSDLIK